MLRQVPETDSVIYYTYTQNSLQSFYRGQKRYELSNHLGNVLAVITDRRIQACGAGDVMHYEAQVVSVSDYYPFGMGIKEREWKDSSFGYRFGFNGMEKDDEVKGTGNSYTAEYWQYDSRLGRRFNVDPVVKHHFSSYQTFSNNPIIFVDPLGNDDYYNRKGQYIGSIGENTGILRVVKSQDVFNELQVNATQGGRVIEVNQEQISRVLSSIVAKSYLQEKEHVANIIFDPDKAIIYAEEDLGGSATDANPYKSYPQTKTQEDGTGFDDINKPKVLIGTIHGHPEVKDGRINESNVSDIDANTAKKNNVATFAVDAYKQEHVDAGAGGMKGQIHKADTEGNKHPNQGTLDDLRTGEYNIGKDALETTGGKK